MVINTKMLAVVLSSQLAITIIAMKFGETFLGWGACIAIALISLASIHLLIKYSLVAPLSQLCATIQIVKMEGNLALRAASNQSTTNIAKTFNELLDNFQSIIGKVIFNSNQVASAAKSLEGMARQVATGSNAQQDAARLPAKQLKK